MLDQSQNNHFFGKQFFWKQNGILVYVAIISLMLAGCSHGQPDHVKPEPYPLDTVKLETVVSSIGNVKHDVYFFSGPSEQAPPVLLLHELPGLSPNTLIFAETLSKNFNVYVPLLFGSPNQENMFSGIIDYLFNNEWDERDSLKGSRYITEWISEALNKIQARHHDQPIGVIGMCLTGAMPLALLDHKEIKAIILAQPSLPLIGGDNDLGISDKQWEQAKQRAAARNIHMLGLRFEHDSIAAREKHDRMKKVLGENVFLDGEVHERGYCQKDADGEYTCPKMHSTLTYDWSKDLPPDHPINANRAKARDFLKTWLIDNN